MLPKTTNPTTMKSVHFLTATLLAFSCSAFTSSRVYTHSRALLLLSGPSFVTSQDASCPSTTTTALSADNAQGGGVAPALVSVDAYTNAIDTLYKDMGMEPVPEDQRPPMYAIGKLVAQLPLEHVSGIRLADCETLTLISQVKQTVVELTGMQSLDTIVAIRSGGDGNGNYGYEGDTRGKPIGEVAAAYTAAVNHAMENQLTEIELEVQRLVPMMPSEE